MLNKDFEVLTTTGALDLTKKGVFAGSPLTNTEAGFTLAKGKVVFVGLSYNYYSDLKNDVTGGEWFADSGKVGIVKIGQVTIANEEGMKVFDDTKTYHVNDALYVDANGLLTNEASAKDDTNKNFVGTVVAVEAGNKSLTVFVNCLN